MSGKKIDIVKDHAYNKAMMEQMKLEGIKRNPSIERTNHDQPRILCIVDGPNWIFKRHVSALERHLGDEFRFSIAYRGQPYQEDEYDLIYPLEFNMVSPEQIRQPIKYVSAIRSFVSWADWDFLALVNFLVVHYHKIHVVSKDLFSLFSPYLPHLSYVTHGVDTNYFTPAAPPSAEAGHLRIGWAGNRNTIVKGFRDFVQPLSSLGGVELVVHGVADRLLSYEQMPGFYNSIDVYICTSSYEGNNNSLLEAAAMERAIVTTPAGTVPEYLSDNQSALIVDRNLEQIQAAILRLRDDPNLRIKLGKNARRSLLDGGWTWKSKAEEYRKLFQAVLKGEQEVSQEPITTNSVEPRHYAEVLCRQYDLMRELRIGYAMNCLELEKQIADIREDAQRQMNEIKASRTYRLVERIKSIKIIQILIKLFLH